MSTQEKNGAAAKLSKATGPRQRRTRFIKEFLLDHNATRAAKAAGYSAKTAESQGSRLLRNAKVKRAIDEADEKLNAKLDISVERVATEYARLAFFDPRKFFNDDGSLKPISELDEDSARAIAGMDVNELFEGNGEKRELAGYCKKLKLADKVRALEGLGRYLKMFTDRIEVTAADAIIGRLVAGRKRAQAGQ